MRRKTADVSYYLQGKRKKIAESPPEVLNFLIYLTEEYGGTIANVYRRSKEKYSCPDAWSILEKYIENRCGEKLAKIFFLRGAMGMCKARRLSRNAYRKMLDSSRCASNRRKRRIF